MADEHQRELERQVASGDFEAEAKLLLERVRSGELTEERLRLAAYCGHGAAKAVVEIEVPKGLVDWAIGFDRWASRYGSTHM